MPSLGMIAFVCLMVMFAATAVISRFATDRGGGEGQTASGSAMVSHSPAKSSHTRTQHRKDGASGGSHNAPASNASTAE